MLKWPPCLSSSARRRCCFALVGLLLLSLYWLQLSPRGDMAATVSGGSQLISVAFEVFGRVQGVFFRAHTRTTAGQMGVVGWCRNTARGTVAGVAQGGAADVARFKQWLRSTGSPQSRVDRADFTDERPVAALEFSSFSIRH